VVSLVWAAVLSIPFAPLVFLGNLGAAAIGVGLWGVGLGIQDSLMSAPVSVVVHRDRRAHAFGVFNAIYGVAWFVGSSALGLLYSFSLPGLVGFSVVCELAAVTALFSARSSFTRAFAR
jgi:hypothetical protein